MPEICRPACPRAPASGAGLGNTTGALDCDCGSYVLQIMGVVISAAPPVWEYSNVRPTRALLLENLHPLADTVLEAQGVEIERRSSALDEDERSEERRVGKEGRWRRGQDDEAAKEREG